MIVFEAPLLVALVLAQSGRSASHQSAFKNQGRGPHPCHFSKGLKKADAGFWWLSFVDPEDGMLLGVVIVWSESFDRALTRCGRLGVDPGGGVRGTKLPKGAEPDKQFLNWLLSAEQIVKNRLAYVR
jgi:hypothetical protein